MWPWIKRWVDWAMREVWSMYRSTPQPQTLRFCYEKAGLLIYDQPVPWNAEGVLVEVEMRLPTYASRRKQDYQLRLPGQNPIAADRLERADAQERYRVVFRVPPPRSAITAEILHQGKIRARLAIPYLSQETFVQSIQVHNPAVFARLGSETVACESFVSTQCQGLIATSLLTAPTSLAPLVDLDLRVVFVSERSNQVIVMSVPFSTNQLSARQSLISVEPRRLPRRMGEWTVSWMVGDRVLASGHIKAVSTRHFQRTLKIRDTRYVLQHAGGEIEATDQMPILSDVSRVGPCFFVSSTEKGMAGLCKVQLRAQVSGAFTPPLMLDEEILFTDAPTMIAPGTLDVGDLRQVVGFELSAAGKSLGVLMMRPAPTAHFNSEGGFKPIPDYIWSAAAEKEMQDRLGKLMKPSEGGN